MLADVIVLTLLVWLGSPWPRPRRLRRRELPPWLRGFFVEER